MAALQKLSVPLAPHELSALALQLTRRALTPEQIEALPAEQLLAWARGAGAV